MSFGLPVADSGKPVGEEPQNAEAGKWPEVVRVQVAREKMNVRYIRIKAIEILQTQGARIARRVLPRKAPS